MLAWLKYKWAPSIVCEKNAKPQLFKYFKFVVRRFIYCLQIIVIWIFKCVLYSFRKVNTFSQSLKILVLLICKKKYSISSIYILSICYYSATLEVHGTFYSLVFYFRCVILIENLSLIYLYLTTLIQEWMNKSSTKML